MDTTDSTEIELHHLKGDLWFKNDSGTLEADMASAVLAYIRLLGGDQESWVIAMKSLEEKFSDREKQIVRTLAGESAVMWTLFCNQTGFDTEKSFTETYYREPPEEKDV